MAFDADIARTELRGLKAPSRLFNPVDEVLNCLSLRVLRESAKLALRKVASGENCTIVREDLLTAVRVVLAGAVDEIEKELGSNESGVRRAS